MGAGFAPNSSSSSCVDDNDNGDDGNNDVDVEHGDVSESKIDGDDATTRNNSTRNTTKTTPTASASASESAWKCTRCDHINTHTKSRCKQCQGWKGGRREGLFSSPSSAASANKAGSARSGGSTKNAASGGSVAKVTVKNAKNTKPSSSSGKKKMNKKQTGNSKGGGKTATVNTTPAAAAAANAGSIEPWKCTRCSHINTYTKARCASCQGWKGGYREGYSPSSNKKSSSQSSPSSSPSPSKRRSKSTPTKRSTAVATSSKGSSTFKTTKKVVAVVVDKSKKKNAAKEQGEETIDAWKCTKCNHTNTYTKSRCKKCQGWKGGKREGYVSPITGRSKKRKVDTNNVVEEEEMEEINTANVAKRRRRNRAPLSSSPAVAGAAAAAAAGQEIRVDKEHVPNTKRTRSSRTCASNAAAAAAAAAADSADTTTSTTMNHSMTAYTQRKSNLSRRPRQFKPTEKIMAMHEDQQLQSKSLTATTTGNTNNKKQQQGRAGIKNTTRGCGKGRINRGGIGQLKHPPELIGSSTASTAATTATVDKRIPHKEKEEESEYDDDDESNYDDVACCLCKCAVDFSDLHFFLPPPREEVEDSGEEMNKSENDNTCANVGSGEKSEGGEHENDKKMSQDELLNNESRKLPARNSFESTAMNNATSTSADSAIGKTNTATTAPSTNTAATSTSILSDELHNEHFEEEKKDDSSSSDNQEGGLKSSSSDNVEIAGLEKAASKRLSANKNDGSSESSDEELSSSSDDEESEEEEEKAPFRLPHNFYNPGNALVLCDGPVYAGKKRQGNSSDDSPEYECNRAYHQQCHFIPVLSIPRGPWRCLICRYRDELYLREKKTKKTTKVGKNNKGGNVDHLIRECTMSDGELTDIFRCVSVHVPSQASSPPLSIPVKNVVAMQVGNSAGLAGSASLPDESAVNNTTVNKTAEKAVVGTFESLTAGEVERNRNVDASANNKTKATALQTNDESVTANSTSVDATMKADGEGELKLSKGVKPVGTDAGTSTNTNSSNDKELKASNSNANSLSDLPDNLAEDENSNTVKNSDFEQVATLEHTFEHLSASLKARLLHQELTTKSKSLISSSLASIRTAEHSMRSFTESARSRKALAERIESSYKNHYANKKRGGKKRKRSSLDIMGLPQELCQCVQRIAVCKTKVRELIAGLENVIKHKPPQPDVDHSLPGAMNLSKTANENCSRKTDCAGDVISELMQWYASQQSQQSMCVDISTEEQVSQANGDKARQYGEKRLLHHLFPEGNLSRRRYEPRTPEAHIDATTPVEAPSLAEEPASASFTGKICDDDNHSHSSGVSLSSLTCANCLLSHASDANDMLLCDGMGCYRAIHMKCLEPKVTLDDLETSDEDDWFCPLCVAHATLIHYAQREYLGDDWYDEVTAKNNKGDTNDEEEETIKEWESAADVFPEASFELRVANKFNQGIMDGETASYLSETFGIKTSASVSGSGDMAGHERTDLLADEEDDEDEDFDHDEENEEGDDSDEERRLASDTICKDELDALSVTSADGSDEGDKSTGTSDNEDGTSSGAECRPRKSKRKRFTLPERSDATSDGDEDDHSGRSSVQQPGGDGVVDVANIVRGKRSRTKVDYRK